MILKSGTFRYTEHTSEIGIEIKSQTWEGFFLTAAAAVKDLILREMPKTERRAAARKIGLKADDMEQLLVYWLNEVAFWMQNKMFIPQVCRIMVDPGRKTLTGTAHGFTSNRVACRLEVKSATFHGLKIQQTAGLLQATVILDV
ncbi:MAG: archease [Elusimicrobia bacterium]|nr:archease [Elusimicrobiota bacterium]